MTMGNTEQKFTDSMDDLRKDLEAMADKASSSSAPATQSDFDRFTVAAETQRETLRKRMLATESRYELDRAKLIDGFRVQLRNLEHEAAEALYAFERRHAATAAEDRRMFERLDYAARGEQ